MSLLLYHISVKVLPTTHLHPSLQLRLSLPSATSISLISSMASDLPIPETRVLAIASHVGLLGPSLSESEAPMTNACYQGRLRVSPESGKSNHHMAFSMLRLNIDMLEIHWQRWSCRFWGVTWLRSIQSISVSRPLNNGLRYRIIVQI